MNLRLSNRRLPVHTANSLLILLIVTLFMMEGGATFATTTPSKRMNLQEHLLKFTDKIRGGATATSSQLPTIQEHPEAEPFEDPQMHEGNHLHYPRHKLQGMWFSGQLLPNVQRLVAGGSDAYARGFAAIKDVYRPADVMMLFLIASLPAPLSKLYHKIYYLIGMRLNNKMEYKEYQRSKISVAGSFVQQGGMIGSAVYAMELFTTFAVNVIAVGQAQAPTKPIPISHIPKHLAPLQKIPGLFANVAYGYWLTKYIIRLKTRLLRKVYNRLPDAETYDRMLNFLIYICASIIILDASEFDLRALVRSLVAVGGLSSLVVGLALKEPASQLLQGAILMASNKFHRNEVIKLGDGTSGKVVDIGLFETTLMGGDDITMKIPHSKMAGQKFSNISRMSKSQAKFELRFHMHDMYRIDEICKNLADEIEQTCPRLITDGSRPFRVIWTDIAQDHIVVTVDTHHSVPPSSAGYWEARELVLKGIAKGTAKSKTKFGMPVRITGSLPPGPSN